MQVETKSFLVSQVIREKEIIKFCRMMYKMSALIGCCMVLVFFTGCYYDKADQVYPVNGGTCDSSVVRLSVELESIMAAHCYACHGGAEGIRTPYPLLALNPKMTRTKF